MSRCSSTVSGAGLRSTALGHRELPEVVQERPALDRRDVGWEELERSRDRSREHRDAMGVRVRFRVGRRQRREQHVQVLIRVDELRGDHHLEMRAPAVHLVFEPLTPSP